MSIEKRNKMSQLDKISDYVKYVLLDQGRNDGCIFGYTAGY